MLITYNMDAIQNKLFPGVRYLYFIPLHGNYKSKIKPIG